MEFDEGVPAALASNLHPTRLRLRFTKLGKIRFTSARDVARMWERALRRSRLPVAYSEGFSPHPLLSFGLALPTCSESRAEYLDLRLSDVAIDQGGVTGALLSSGEIDAAHLPALLSPLLPDGMEVEAAAVIAHARGSLQQEVTSCSWELEVLGVIGEELAERVELALDAPCIPIRRERKGRTVEDDLRPSILSLTPMEVVTGPNPVGGPSSRLRADLSTQPRGVRPRELLEGLGTDLVLVRACRTHQWIERDGVRTEPLLPQGASDETVAPHAQERAS
jgi:radical SAM-linked protein